jgi:hypothetical protein
MRFTLPRLLIGIVALFLVAELGLRVSGAVNFPLYHVDDEIGYIPKPDQSGSFLRSHAWVFNDRSMGTALKWNPHGHPNILLIGNSVVMGGNPVDQKEKLGTLLQRDVGDAYSVWPIAAGGWSNVNEMVYVKRNPDVFAQPRAFIWEYMTGGLSSLHTWAGAGKYVFPTDPPLCASCYVFRRYLWPRIHPTNESELPPVGPIQPVYRAEFESMITSLSQATDAPHVNVIFLYPKEFEYLEAKAGKNWLADRDAVEQIAAAAGVTVVDIAKQSEWNETLYRDGIHPTAEGNAVLAKILAAAIQPSLRNNSTAQAAGP